MAKTREFPEEGELVVGTVREVQNFGAFIVLEEYPGKEGFCHIREVAAGWVKRIRDFVRERQRVVCKVHGVNESKGHIDLSLKAVNDHQRRETIQAWKNEQKADKFFELLAERNETTVEALMEAYGNQLITTFGSLYTAFEEAAEYGQEVFDEEKIEGDWIPAFIEFAKENIAATFVEINGFLEATTRDPDGVAVLSKALGEAEKGEYDDVEIEVAYMGAPHYRVNVKAPDYKIAEEELRKAADRAVKALTKAGGKAIFHREMEAAA
ncbi:MAG: translation initiation factor IF-2 subunit alpha [Thermoplasmatota archaeon]